MAQRSWPAERLVRPAPIEAATAGRRRHALVAADRCRAGQLVRILPLVRRSSRRRAIDARVVAAAVVAADDGGHGLDCVADRRARSGDGGVAVRDGCRAGVSAVHAGADRSSQRSDRTDVACRGGDVMVGSQVVVRLLGRRAQRRAAGDRHRMPAVSRGVRTGVGFALCRGSDAGVALARYGLALALFTALGFGASVGPQHWTRKLCDAIAINTAAATICGGLLLALAGRLRHRDRITRIAAVLGSGAATLAVLLLLEPRCLRGPMAMVDPAI